MYFTEEQIKKYTPIVFLHLEEKYRPISVEEYIKKASLFVRENREAKYIGPATEEYVNNPLPNSYLFSREDWNHYSYSILPTCYYASRELSDGSKQLQFHFFFPYNKGYVFGIGDHWADWEGIIMHFDKEENLKYVFFSSHKQKDGYWKRKEDCEFIDGRLAIYSALGSHGFYHKPATWYRFLGVANDHTSKGHMLFPDPQPVGLWFQKGIDWGPDGIGSPYFVDEEEIINKKSNTFFRRLFCCFYCKNCEKLQDSCMTSP